MSAMKYSDKPWTKSYDPGVPASLSPYPDKPVYELLEDTAKNLPDQTAILVAPRRLGGLRPANKLTYSQLNELSSRFAAGLAALGVKKGDRVAIAFPNSAQFVISFFGILKAGGVVVALNPTYPPAKWAEQLNDSGAETVITMSRFYEGLNSVRGETPIKRMVVSNIKEYFPGLIKTLFTLATEKKSGDRVSTLHQGDVWFQDVIAQYNASQRPQIKLDPSSDTAIFQYTGGTTGVPKAAQAPHRALVANAMQLRSWLPREDEQGQEIYLAAIPFFHVYGMVAVMINAVTMGGSMIMVANARDIDDVLDCIHTFKPTIFMGVPALYNAINFHKGITEGKYSLKSVRACISGSAPLAPETKRRFEELSGGKVMEGFGMSEAPTATHCNPLNGVNKTGSIGLPLPDVECRIISLDDGKSEMPVGEIGEISMRGPNLMTGYHNMPTETSNALRDGWLYTGDIGRMDEQGYFFIVDRKKDMVLIGGFNVYPNNVEKALREHEAVIDVGVAGVPHPEREGQEALKAWVVVAPDKQVTADELIDFCSKKLAPYEVPRRVEFVSELPKTTVGKILRRDLVKMEMENQAKN
jgi:long-chain acyl-CoA synthetase